LARALAWQARGHRFESGILHPVNIGLHRCEGFFYFIKCTVCAHF